MPPKKITKKNKKFYIACSIGIVLLFALLICIVFWYKNSRVDYEVSTHDSPITESLRMFYINRSQHAQDPVPGCWYDAGDYVIFISRNTRALVYLSYAFTYAKDPAIKAEIKEVINQQLGCVESMIDLGYKQFRDQHSHGINLPPLLNEKKYPQNYYPFRSGEGRDVHILLSIIYGNLGDAEKAAAHLEDARRLNNRTVSEHCCEEGPLLFSDKEISSLNHKAEIPFFSHSYDIWALSFISLKNVEDGYFDAVANTLQAVKDGWDGKGKPFQYQSSNYHIAGTIALERMYAAGSGDEKFKGISDDMWKYLHGENMFSTDFTDIKNPYHPCGFFKKCDLGETLVNGIDSKGVFDLGRKDVWRNTEPQIFGQACYVLAKVLYLGL